MNDVHITETEMFKALFTLARAGAAKAEEEFCDRNALAILEQQLREVTVSLADARRQLALALARRKQDETRRDALSAEIVDLEIRARAALADGDEGLAREGAQAIATLEADREALARSLAAFGREIDRLGAWIDRAAARLAELERGRRVAAAAEAARRLRRGRIEPAGLTRSTLSEAEATLARLRARQNEAAGAEDALDGLEAAPEVSVAEKLAAAGYGPKLKTTADDVLARLRGARS